MSGREGPATGARLRRRWERLRAAGQRGSVSAFAVVLVMSLFVAIGLVVDGGRKIRAIEEANALAADAARVAANQIDVTALNLSGGRPRLDPYAAIGAGNAALAAGGADMGASSVSVSGNLVTVTAAVSVPTTFLAIIGVGTVTGVGEAQVEPIPGISSELP